jgi:hypothetical protein
MDIQYPESGGLQYLVWQSPRKPMTDHHVGAEVGEAPGKLVDISGIQQIRAVGDRGGRGGFGCCDAGDREMTGRVAGIGEELESFGSRRCEHNTQLF